MPHTTTGGPNVLVDPLITIEHPMVCRELALGELLGELLSGQKAILSFPHLAAEQRGYWWRFLVRCAAKALREAGRTVRDASAMATEELAEQLTRILIAATGGDHAWALYQPDPKLPGFLQPPTPDGNPPEQTYKENSAAYLTCIVGSKNHERKSEQLRELTAETAVYALVELQLGAIFGGRYNYGSQLIGSAVGKGSGSPFMTVVVSDDLRDSFRHDVRVLLDRWDSIRAERGVGGTVWALWTEPWDGKRSLPAKDLDPAFIPMARLIRLGPPNPERFDTVWFRSSDGPRVDDHTGGGTLGDIFTPFVFDERKGIRKVRGTPQHGYDYREIVRLLFRVDGGEPSDTVADLIGDVAAPTRARVVFEGIAFDQGKTEGFHSRSVLLPIHRVRSFARNPEPLHAVHRLMLEAARESKNILRAAARILLHGDIKSRTGDQDKVELGAKHLEALIDAHYVASLLDAAERHSQGDRSYEQEWKNRLAAWTLEAYDRTRPYIPTPVGQRYRREVDAEDFIRARLRKLGAEPFEPVEAGGTAA